MEQKQEQMPRITKAQTCEIFHFVEREDGVQIAIGNYLVTNKKFKNIKNAENYLQKKPYELIINLIGLSVEKALENYENSKKDKESK